MNTDLDVIQIDHPACTALVAYQGAQLLQWTPKGAAESLLWMTPEHFWQPGRPIRGGIPLCWPWFGKVDSPSHGFARLLNWTLIEHEETSDKVGLVFELKSSSKTLTYWPHPFVLRLHHQLGETYQAWLEIDCDHPTTGALHTYLALSDITQVSIENLEAQLLSLKGPVDQIYPNAPSLTVLKDPVRKHQIQLEHQNASDLVLWTPWQQGAEKLKDMHDDDYKKFVCIETAAINQPLGQQIGVRISQAPLKV